MAHDSRKIYLGDAVYAEHTEADQIRLWTSNGAEELSVIYLEPEVFAVLKNYARSVWSQQKETS